jgi:hypothetical protein
MVGQLQDEVSNKKNQYVKLKIYLLASSPFRGGWLRTEKL